jgi:hypothetical protein
MPLGKRTLNKFREHLVSWTLGQIGDEFSAAGINPNRDYDPPMSGERRRFVEQHYASLNLENSSDERKLLSFFENVLLEASPDSIDDLVKLLARDGYKYENDHIIRVVYDFDHLLILPIIRYFPSQTTYSSDSCCCGKRSQPCCRSFKRIDRNVLQDYLGRKGNLLSGSPDLPQLTKAVFKELGLVPDDISDAAKGADTIKRTLSNLASVAQGIVELRNLYGSVHGRDGRWQGVKPRHAQLAVGAASTLATFLMQTHFENKEEDKRKGLRLDELSGRYVISNFQDGKGTGAEISIQELDQSKVEMQGLAIWVNEAAGTANLGDFHGVFASLEDKVIVQEEECNIEVVLKRGQLESNRQP